MTTPPRRPGPSGGTTRRSRRLTQRRESFLERHRTRLLIAGAAAIVAIVAGSIFLNSSTPAYACTTLFDPTPAPAWTAPPTAAPGESAGPEATPPPPGYVQPDMGHLHVDPGERVRFANCPPASGRHYNAGGQGPLRSKVYGPTEQALPQGWVHNLEHGDIVLLYNCGENGDPAACTDAGQAALASLYGRWPASPLCKIPPGGQTPVIARFDDMAYPYAALVWNVVLPLQTLDETAIFEFYAARGERFNPEKQCADPTPTPRPTPTAGPTGTAAPSATASPGATATPS